MNQPASSNVQAEAAIRRVLEKWSPDFNAKNIDAVCALFAPDTRLTYPGAPERDYAAMCAGFQAQLARTDRVFRYDPPEIQEIIVSGDLAVVRLIWTSRITGQGLTGEVVEREQGLDIFKKQPDGSWKIYISYAHPIE